MKNESYKTQEERLRYLIRAMQKEMPQYRGIVIPEDSAGQKQLLRSLMNVRPPMPADPEFLAEQDLYLSEEIAARGILDGADLAPVGGYHTSEDGRDCKCGKQCAAGVLSALPFLYRQYYPFLCGHSAPPRL